MLLDVVDVDVVDVDDVVMDDVMVKLVVVLVSEVPKLCRLDQWIILQKSVAQMGLVFGFQKVEFVFFSTISI